MRLKEQFDPSKVFFTSDHHFGHDNIRKYSNRPFNSVEEMDRVLIERWNYIVPKDGIVFHLGDISLQRNSDLAEDQLYKLNGKIYFVWGNHDSVAKDNRERFELCADLLEITVEKTYVVLCHYAMLVWQHSYRGTWHLFGHSHSTLPENPNSLSFDIGVDTNNYCPYSWDEICNIMNKKTYTPPIFNR